MDYMFQEGFLGTRAPLFMDSVTLIVAFLPIIMAGAIFLAQRKKYKAHAMLQRVLFFVSIAVIIYFEFGVRVGGGFSLFMTKSSVSHSYALSVLVVHIVIALIGLLLWSLTLFRVKQFSQKRHKLFGYITLVAMMLTSLSSMWVYLILFVY